MENENKEKSWKDRLGNLLFEEDRSGEESGPEIQKAEGGTQSADIPTGDTAGTAPAPGPAAGDSLDLAAIYRGAGIQDDQFATPEQVLELKKTFADLPGDVQRQKVIKTLSSFKVDVAKVADNTQRKIAAIEKYVGGVRTEGVSTIDTSNQTIEELQKQMDSCKQRIMETQSLLDRISREGQGAIADLKAVMDFLGVAPPPAASTPVDKSKNSKSK